jgi:hypothetical protein
METTTAAVSQYLLSRDSQWSSCKYCTIAYQKQEHMTVWWLLYIAGCVLNMRIYVSEAGPE